MQITFKTCQTLSLITILYVILIIKTLKCNNEEDYTESLVVKPLPDGHLYAFFEFKTIWHKDLHSINWANRFNIFPLSLGKLISRHEVQELHFSLTKGIWKHQRWGYAIREAPPNAQLWLWFQHFHKNPQKAWRDITSELSGQFCASINFIDNSATIQPKYSLRPEGVIDGDSLRNGSLFYGALPHESVCTENLTPWKKWLPCFSAKGLATLLNAGHLFNSYYFSLAVDFKPICRNIKCESTSVELIQSISVVFNPPVMFEGKQSWSLVKLFGAPLTSTCSLSSKSTIYIDITDSHKKNNSKLSPEPTKLVYSVIGGAERKYAAYDVNQLLAQNKKTLNIGQYFQNTFDYTKVKPPPLFANRFIKGYGLSDGGITCHIFNNFDKPIEIVYFDVIPWYLRMYLHTLSIVSNGKSLKPHTIYYNPSKDRIQSHHLEILLVLPPNSMTDISFQFERVFLKWTEYPPDANHGVYVNSAIISAKLNSDRNFTYLPIRETISSENVHFIRIYTQTLLVSLPTPDFSMPYNVICLVSTVVSLAFGPIHNLTTRRTRIVNNSSQSKKSKSLINKIKSLFKKKDKTETSDTNQ
ncbi:GPI transamidase component PIG-T-like [Oppia nitens]|uniref:GPI transamidase component PIG-T-like n=1 Tax=Oppia nitens TaxID=1686743 RepID=UPI0023DB5392|nr:GPI transamidase component PIG-T-like [Oppia nitens]